MVAEAGKEYKAEVAGTGIQARVVLVALERELAADAAKVRIGK